MAFGLSLFVPCRSFFLCCGKAVLRNCGIAFPGHLDIYLFTESGLNVVWRS